MPNTFRLKLAMNTISQYIVLKIAINQFSLFQAKRSMNAKNLLFAISCKDAKIILLAENKQIQTGISYQKSSLRTNTHTHTHTRMPYLVVGDIPLATP